MASSPLCFPSLGRRCPGRPSPSQRRLPGGSPGPAPSAARRRPSGRLPRAACPPRSSSCPARFLPARRRPGVPLLPAPPWSPPAAPPPWLAPPSPLLCKLYSTAHDAVAIGCIALNAVQRRQTKVSAGDPITVSSFAPPDDFKLALLTLELEYAKAIANRNEELDAIAWLQSCLSWPLVASMPQMQVQ